MAVGADRDAAAAFLEDENEGRPEIEAAQRQLRDLGVSGIPTLILGGKYQLPSGAHHAESLIRAFRQVEAEGGATAGAAQPAALEPRLWVRYQLGVEIRTVVVGDNAHVARKPECPQCRGPLNRDAFVPNLMAKSMIGGLRLRARTCELCGGSARWSER